MTKVDIAISELGGSRGAPLLVLGPSLGTSTIMWSQVVPLLTSNHRVVAWDLPGHGVSPAANGAFSTGDLADALAPVLISTAAGEKIRYAGVSLGGAVGLELMLAHPGLVEKALIVCSGAVIGEPGAWLERAAHVRAQGTASLVVSSATKWFAPTTMATYPELTGRMLHALRDADDESYARCCEALAEYDARDRLAEISVPVLALWGAHDQVTPEASARTIADGVQNGRAVGVSTASHLAPVDDPERIAWEASHFFDEGQS